MLTAANLRASSIAIVIVLAGIRIALAGQAAPTCRTYATRQTGQITSSTGAATGRTEQTCTPFNRSTSSMRCTLTTSFAGNVTTQVITGHYQSVSDFVDEVRAIPPAMRLIRQEMTAPSTQSSLAVSYDPQRRPLRSVLTSPNGEQNSAFSGWDNAGRYTEVLLSSPATPTERVIYSYDDTARTMTIENRRIGSKSVYTYDADANLIRTVSSSSSGTMTIAVTINATDKVCR